MKAPIVLWLQQYISQCLKDNPQNASHILSQIIDWRDSRGGDSLNEYSPAIVGPAVYVLAENWTGDDCLLGLKRLARHHGLASLDPLVPLMRFGLDLGYQRALRQAFPPTVGEPHIIEQEFDARWLAVETMYDLLQRADRNSPDGQRYISNVKFLAGFILNDADAWKRRCGQYPESAIVQGACIRIKWIEGTLRAILNNL